jgi:RsiW-degrading membrane proteinase PrsW (M82 family)
MTEPMVAEALPLTTTRSIGLRLNLLAILLALLGGVLGIFGAAVEEVRSGGGGLGIIFAAPIIEEAMKPAGIYILLIRWPQALRGRLHTAFLTALSGLCFGLIESAVYVLIYYPDEGSAFLLFRFTVTPALHVVTSFLVGLGLSRSLIDWANGKSPLPKPTRNFYLLGVLIHAVYNTTAVLLSLTDVLSFD